MPVQPQRPSRRSALTLLAAGGAASRPGPHRTRGHRTATPLRPLRFTRPAARSPDPLRRPARPGDHTDIQSAVDAASGTGHTLVLAPASTAEPCSSPPRRQDSP
ncbi:hypothetical protein NKH18_10475 [Streptomyces sp. M10(2022)]